MRLLALLLLASLALAGCSDVQKEHSFTVPDDAPSRTDAHDGAGYDLRVRVTDETGNPLAGAAVVLFTMKEGWGGSVSAGAETSQGATVAFWEADFASYDLVAGLRTNKDGIASAELKPNSQIHVAAGDVAGMTTEVRTDVALAGSSQSGGIDIALYPEHITYGFDVSFGNHVGGAGALPGQSEAYKIAFSDDEALGMAYAQRILNLGGTVTWTNDMQQGGDLHLGIGDDQTIRWVGADKQQFAFDGTHTESITVASSDLDGQRGDLVERGYHAHIITDWVTLSFDGLDATIEVEAMLKGSNIKIN